MAAGNVHACALCGSKTIGKPRTVAEIMEMARLLEEQFERERQEQRDKLKGDRDG